MQSIGSSGELDNAQKSTTKLSAKINVEDPRPLSPKKFSQNSENANSPLLVSFPTIIIQKEIILNLCDMYEKC